MRNSFLSLYSYSSRISYISTVWLWGHTQRLLHFFCSYTFVSQKSIVVYETATQILSVLYRKKHIDILNEVFFFTFSFFFFSCSPCCASPCAGCDKAMMIVDLIRNAIRKFALYLTLIIFFFYLRHYCFKKDFNGLIDLRESWILLFSFLHISLCK
jgi:hypothetical protein